MSLKNSISGALPNITIVATGLNTSPNSINTPDGSLQEAVNVIIRRDNLMEPRRGFQLFGDAFGTSTDRANQLFQYRSAILRQYADVLQFQSGIANDGTVEFSDFEGSYTAPSSQRMKGIEVNGNFYFTTSNGVKKISAVTSSDFSTAPGYITNAGGIKAIDFSAQLDITQGSETDFLQEDSVVGYRTVWGTTDANNNLILGTPSQYVQVFNPMLSLLLLDFDTVLEILDNLNQAGSLITFGHYVSTWNLPQTANALELYNNLNSVCVQLDTDIYLANNSGTGVPLTIASDQTYTISSVNTSTSTLTTSSTHNLEAGYMVRFTGSSLPSPIIAGVNYYVINPTSNTFQISVTKGGTALSITTTGSGTITVNFFAAFDNGSQIYTITFSSGTTSNYFSVQDWINLTGFSSTGTGTINGQWQISAVDSNTITFTVGSGTTGNNNVTNGQIHSYNFQKIASQFTEPTLPTTNAQLVSLQNFIKAIVNQLALEPNAIIPSGLVAQYIDPFSLTTTASVTLTIQIPQDITSNYFLQIYRTKQVTATGTDVLSTLTAGDEEQQMYEAFPTSAELAAGQMIVHDDVSDAFLASGTFLYTNATTGDGINQANDPPPLAVDITSYKNYTFYANTKTKYSMLLDLLGVANMISDYNAGKTPTVTIANGTVSSTYSFIPGVEQESTVTTSSYSSVTDGSYFFLNSANNETQYYVWFYKGSGADPAIAGKTGIKVDLTIGSISTANQVATRLANVLKQYIFDFTIGVSTNVVTITNTEQGITNPITDVNTGFSFATINAGNGQNIQKNTTQITAVAESSGNYLNGSVGRYFTLNSQFNKTQYYVWFQTNGVGNDPALSGKVGIKVSITTGESAPSIASAISTALTSVSNRFNVTVNSAILTIQNFYYGPATASTAGNSPLTGLTTTVVGCLNVLLSTNISPAISIDETARSFVSIINKNNNSDVYGFYTSGPSDTPGQMQLESREIGDTQFSVLTNDSNTGGSFNPNISPTFSIVSVANTIATGNPSIITINNHGFKDNQQVILNNSNSVPNIDGVYNIKFVSTNSFSIPVNVTTAGNQISAASIANAESGNNSVSPNRLYYSKLQQPEAVPALNFIDIGAQDQPIMRIYPLRNSLFVFKTDGIYLVSSETAPFNLTLFDGSQIIIAPDSIGLVSNLIYVWTGQGLATLSESGVQVVSRAIDNIILTKTDANYPSFSTATWGVGYQSDSAYIVYTVQEETDTVATIAYRFNILTNTWTTYDKTNTCGLINQVDDRLYMGAGNTNFIEQERKAFDRTDYADWQFSDTLLAGNINGLNLSFPVINNYQDGYVITQTQYLTIYAYNQILKKLDNDLGTQIKDYTSLTATEGCSLRTQIVELADLLDTDNGLSYKNYASDIASISGNITAIAATNPTQITCNNHGLKTGRYIQIVNSDSVPSIDGNYMVTVLNNNVFTIDVDVTTPGTTGVFTTLDQNFLDIQGCFNILMLDLNADSGTVYKNYSPVTESTLYEAIIVAKNNSTKVLTVNLALPWVQGPVTIYQAIDSYFIYNPITFQDPMSYKQIREGTLIFQNKQFTTATISFASDLLPAFISYDFPGDGNGIFGYQNFGNKFFGGTSNAAPFRTYIPRDLQRCRYLTAKFEHNVARETYQLLGITLVGNQGISTRAYR